MKVRNLKRFNYFQDITVHLGFTPDEQSGRGNK